MTGSRSVRGRIAALLGALLVTLLAGCGDARPAGGERGGTSDQPKPQRSSQTVEMPAFPVRVTAPEAPVSLPMARDKSGQLDAIEAPGPDGKAVRFVLETGASASILSSAAVERYPARHLGLAPIALGLSDAQERRCDVFRIEKAGIGDARWEDWTVLSGVPEVFSQTGADGLLGADVLCGGAAFAWEPGAGRFWIAKSLDAIVEKLGPPSARLPLVPAPTRKIFRPAVRLDVDGAGEQTFMIDSGSNKSVLVLPDAEAVGKAARRMVGRDAGNAEAQGADGKIRIVPVSRIAVDLSAGDLKLKDVEVLAYADARGHCGTVNVVGQQGDGREAAVYRQGVLGNSFLHRFSYVAFDCASRRICFGAPTK